jgi:restriction system protein
LADQVVSAAEADASKLYAEAKEVEAQATKLYAQELYGQAKELSTEARRLYDAASSLGIPTHIELGDGYPTVLTNAGRGRLDERFAAAVKRAESTRYRRKVREWDQILASGMPEIDKMTGTAFETRIAVLLRELGYKAEVTRATGDFGADIIAERGGVKTVVQTKRQASSVGVKAIQEGSASRHYYDADNVLIVTNSTFTPQARELAARAGVDLWDRAVLAKKLQQANRRTKRRRT